jgi:hypothetical protein
MVNTEIEMNSVVSVRTACEKGNTNRLPYAENSRYAPTSPLRPARYLQPSEAESQRSLDLHTLRYANSADSVTALGKAV